MSSGLGEGAGAEWRNGWRLVVAAALGVGMMSAPTYSVGVFMAPLEAEFGWKRAAISSTLMLIGLASILLGPLVGLVVDRVGPRRVAVPGVVLVCLSIALLSLTTPSLWSWWGLWCVVAISGLLIKPLVWTAAVSSQFSKSRGLALAVTLCGTSLASVATPIFCTWLMRLIGWRGAYVGLSILLAVLVIPPVIFLFKSNLDERRDWKWQDKANPEAGLQGFLARDAFASHKFYRLLVAAFLMAFAPAAIGTSMVPIVTSFGHSALISATIAGLSGGAAIIGRLTGGILLDRISGNVVAGFCMILPAIGISLMILWPDSVSALIAGSMIVGLSVGAELDAVAYLTTRHFGVRSFGVLFGVVGAGLSTATAIGPLFLNSVYDASGAYDGALMAYLPICAAGAILFFTLGTYPDFEHHVSTK